MRVALLFLAGLLIVAGCNTQDKDEKQLREAQEELARARQKVEKAREKVRKSTRDLRRDSDDWVKDAQREAERALDEARRETDRALDQAQREAERALEDLGVEGSDLSRTLGKVMEDVGLALQDESEVQVLDRSTLTSLLPDQIAGARLHSSNADHSGAWGIQLAHVTGKYQDGADGRIKLTIADLGTLRGVLGQSRDLMDASVRHRDRHDWRRTTLIDGHPALLERRTRPSGKVEYTATMTVADRFLVRLEAEGERFDDELPETALKSIRPDRLARLSD